MQVTTTPEYRRIADVYGVMTTRRSGMRLMRHIDHGLLILDAIGASDIARRAFCLHPLVQGDAAFKAALPTLATLDPAAVALAVEYRAVANVHLSTHPPRPPSTIALSPLVDVNAMLVADKVQNHHDFRLFHARTHPRAARLQAYFDDWLERLGVDAGQLAGFTSLLTEAGVAATDDDSTSDSDDDSTSDSDDDDDAHAT